MRIWRSSLGRVMLFFIYMIEKKRDSQKYSLFNIHFNLLIAALRGLFIDLYIYNLEL